MKSILMLVSFFFLSGQTYAIASARMWGMSENPKADEGRVELPCANFSGDWKGSCTSLSQGTEKKSEASVRIGQVGCALLTVVSDGYAEVFTLDEVKTETRSSQERTMTSVQKSRWSGDRREWEIETNGVLRSFGGLTEATQDEAFSTFITLKLDNGVLLAESVAHGRGADRQACVFQKQAP